MSYDKYLLEEKLTSLLIEIKLKLNFFRSNILFSMPSISKKSCILRSSFVDSSSKEHLEIKKYQNIIKIEPRTENINNFISDMKRYFGPFNERLLTGGTTTNYGNYNKYNNINKGSPNFLKKDEKYDNIQISFHIIIDMELQKGTSLSKEQISNIKCIKGWNKVRKSFAEFTGKKYVIPPVYENLSDKFNKKEESKPNDNNKTKKINGGSRKKTIKKH